MATSKTSRLAERSMAWLSLENVTAFGEVHLRYMDYISTYRFGLAMVWYISHYIYIYTNVYIYICIYIRGYKPLTNWEAPFGSQTRQAGRLFSHIIHHMTCYRICIQISQLLVGGLEHNWIIFHIGNNNPIWWTHIFQRGRYTTNQVSFGMFWSCIPNKILVYVSIPFWDMYLSG